MPFKKITAFAKWEISAVRHCEQCTTYTYSPNVKITVKANKSDI
jgi:hypothetical protein